MVINFLHRRTLTKTLVGRLSTVAFFLSMAYATFDTVWSIHLFSFLGNASAVGFFSGTITLFSVLCFIFLAPVIASRSEKGVWMFSALGLIAGYFILFLAPTLIFVVIGALIYAAASVLHQQSQGIIVSNSCKKKDLGRTEGLLISIQNVGWIVGPLIAGFIAAKLGVNIVFLFALIFVMLGVFIFKSIALKKYIHKSRNEGGLLQSLKNMKRFFSDKKLRFIYVLSGGMSFYWAIIYIFGPLYMISQGLPNYTVGIFLFAVPIPLVLFEYVVGKFADRRGFRKLFLVGYLTLALFAILAFVAGNVYFTLAFLVLGSIGASLIEATRESFFFKAVKRVDEEDFYGPYRTHNSLFGVVSKILASLLLLFTPLKYVFFFLGIVMTFFALLSTKIKE